MMKLIFILFLPVLLFAGHIKTDIRFSGNPKVALKLVSHSFYLVGYRLDINNVTVHFNEGVIEAVASGNKPLNLSQLNENFKEQTVIVKHSAMEQGLLKLNLNLEQASWSIPVVEIEEGVELQRSIAAQWFRIDGGKMIRFEPPYSGKWYPDVAVLDSSLNVLYSWRSMLPKETIELSLPENGYYLKISNAQGMKMLKEGMWVESIIPEH